MEYEKRAAIVVALRAGRKPREIAEFLNLPRSLVYRVKGDFDTAKDQKEFQPKRKKHTQRSDAKRSEEFFESGLRVNANGYIKVLNDVVKPWMDATAGGRDYVFQQDSAPPHKAKTTQAWLTMNVPYHWSPDLWLHSSPDCNPLDYYLWGVVEKDVNRVPHNTLESVKTTIVDVMASLDKDAVATACSSFRSRLEAVVAAKGGHIE